MMSGSMCPDRKVLCALGLGQLRLQRRNLIVRFASGEPRWAEQSRQLRDGGERHRGTARIHELNRGLPLENVGRG